jgi:hypothetical protein
VKLLASAQVIAKGQREPQPSRKASGSPFGNWLSRLLRLPGRDREEHRADPALAAAAAIAPPQSPPVPMIPPPTGCVPTPRRVIEAWSQTQRPEAPAPETAAPTAVEPKAPRAAEPGKKPPAAPRPATFSQAEATGSTAAPPARSSGALNHEASRLEVGRAAEARGEPGLERGIAAKVRARPGQAEPSAPRAAGAEATRGGAETTRQPGTPAPAGEPSSGPGNREEPAAPPTRTGAPGIHSPPGTVPSEAAPTAAGPSEPAAPPPALPGPPATLVDQAWAKVAEAFRAGQREVTLRVSPPDRGEVQIQLQFKRGRLEVHLSCEAPGTFQEFSRDLPLLEHRLHEAGIEGGIDLSYRDQRNPEGDESPSAAPADPEPGRVAATAAHPSRLGVDVVA